MKLNKNIELGLAMTAFSNMNHLDKATAETAIRVAREYMQKN